MITVARLISSVGTGIMLNVVLVVPNALAANHTCSSQGGVGGNKIGASMTCIDRGSDAPSDVPASGPPKNGVTTTTVQAPPPDCRPYPGPTGPEMAAYAARFVVPMYPPPAAGWQAHATDLDGRWYIPECRFSAGTVGSADNLERRAIAYANNNPTFWSATAPTPPPVPVADLVDRVTDSQQIPAPVVELNPDGQTVTGLPTWVWPTEGALRPVVSRVESGPNWAQVTATPGKLVLSAPDGAQVGPCADPKVWSAGQPEDATDCYVTFRRSSAGQPGNKATVSVRVTWSVELTTSDGINNGPIDAITRSTPVQIGVAQVQSVLR